MSSNADRSPRGPLPGPLPHVLSALALAALGGCVFMPQQGPVEEPPAAVLRPDPEAPRSPPLETRHFTLGSESQALLGETQVIFTRYENTFPAIARQYNLGYEELRHANPGVDHWLPGEATPVYLPTQSILPDTPREGILINVAAMRLYYFATEDSGDSTARVTRVTSHPIGVGAQGWATPIGEAKVTQKARDPIWYVPASVRKEHAERGDPLPRTVPPGPDNPLGRFAMALSLPGYLIHGTNKPAGVGMRSSHGCIRLYPEDIEELFERVAKGTPVRIVNEPVLATWHDGQLFLEVHRPLEEDNRDLGAEAYRALARALARAGITAMPEIDPAIVETVVAERRGIPFPVLRSERSPQEHLAASRIVENLVPVTAEEQTVRAVEPDRATTGTLGAAGAR
jgi:L,D-transpeptidase ErfK/SrfK